MPLSDREPRLDSADPAVLFAAYLDYYRRAVARKLGVHRREVRKALSSAMPAERKVPERERPKLAAAIPFIDAILEADRKAPRKQRHTAHRTEGGYLGEGIFYEEVVSTHGFSRAYSIVYHRRPPTRARLFDDSTSI